MFGLSCAAEVFKYTIHTTLQGIQKAFNISHDILIHGGTQGEHDDNLRQVFEQVRVRNITLNREKCVFNSKTSVSICTCLETRRRLRHSLDTGLCYHHRSFEETVNVEGYLGVGNRTGRIYEEAP